ncbi:hypothetical protein FSP39_022991 [Pinctada imbricata]|uniref:Fe2OG dioxygenase domain-containing protein n=1 Tax=Pinctada imbricata TaxID=66713 RepID=A0AA88XQS9_PINIB|nr:hypothetical protein FSP39_022991 [Pinctada imbricata]
MASEKNKIFISFFYELQKIKKQSKLKCFNRDTRIPIYKSKEEVVNYFPRISLFHDVIGEEHISLLKEIGQMLVSNYVLFQIKPNSWANETTYRPLQKLTRRVSLITGLQTKYKSLMSNSEQFQIINYGVGGMYNPHVDNLGYSLLGFGNPHETMEVQHTGDRTATWMFYLSDVRAGGATVFPQLKARVPVVKGAAAFWYNIKLNGDPDDRTRHAGCPVLLGSKWVSNKWIRESGQVLKRLCGLHKDAIEILPTK